MKYILLLLALASFRAVGQTKTGRDNNSIMINPPYTGLKSFFIDPEPGNWKLNPKADSTPLSSMQYFRFVIPGDTSRVLFYENGNIVVKGDTIAIIKYLATQMFYEKAKAQAANKQIDLIEERRRKKIKQ